MPKRTPSKLEYNLAWETERMSRYPVIDAFEERMGFAVDRERLEAAARVLACPVKKNPPNWQHGRVIYALGRRWLRNSHPLSDEEILWLDVGTAKGFSALCMAWAASDDSTDLPIRSFDIIDPDSLQPRNSVEDCKVVFNFVEPFLPEHWGGALTFMQVPCRVYGRIGFAFIDGSHTYDGVKSDIATVTPRQQSGDIIMFDDVQKETVARAVSELQGYDLEHIKVLPTRKYCIAVKQ